MATTTLGRRGKDMGYRLNAERGRHCSRRLMLEVGLLALAGAGSWAQTAVDPDDATAKPAKAQAAPPKKLNLYTGQAKDLLSSTRWENLLAMQPTPDAEEVSDSRDWSDTKPVVKVESEWTAPEVP